METQAQQPLKKFVLSGQVLDDSGMPVPLEKIRLNPGAHAHLTDTAGKFKFRLPPGTYTFLIQSLGSREVLDTIDLTKGDVELTIRLVPLSAELGTVLITSRMNPALRVMRNVIANKPRNNPVNVAAYEYEAYTRLVLSMDNVTDERLKRSKGILRPVRQYLERTQDSTLRDSSGRLQVPVYINETVSRVYYKNPRRKEVVEANRNTGIEGVESSLLSTMLTEVNVYENTIKFLGQGFESPLSDVALIGYDYELDKVFPNGQDTTFVINFKPKYKDDKGFTGRLVTSNRGWALHEISFRLTGSPPVNWIKYVELQQEFTPVDSLWLPSLNDVLIDFKNQQKGTGMVVNVVSRMDRHVLGRPREEKFYKGEDLEILPGSGTRDTSYWTQKRKVPYTKREKLGYDLITKMKRTFIWKLMEFSINLVTEGRIHLGPVNIGEYVRFFSFNPIEGPRFQVGVYTNNFFHERWFLTAHVAYGVFDRRFKYNLDATYRIIEKPKLEISLKRQQDIEQVGMRNYDTEGNSFFQSVLMRVPRYQMNYFTENTLSLSWDVMRGLALTTYVKNKTFEPVSLFNLRFGAPGEVGFYRYVNTEFGLLARISFREKFFLKNGNKIYLGSKFPQIYVEYRAGLRGFLRGQFNYHNLDVTATGKIRFGRAGFLNYTLSGGAIFGRLPFPLLYVFRGSQSLSMDPNGHMLGAVRSSFSPRNFTAIYDPVSFNLMYFYEFVADKYLLFGFDYHMGGLVLGRIPLLKKLKWAEVFSGRLGWGTLSPQNRAFNYIENQQLKAPSHAPYMEVGIGIENIFRVIRIDVVGRLFYWNPVPSGRQLRGFEYNWGVRINVDFSA